MSEIELGQPISGPAYRDAVHVAVIPVTAGQRLHAGERVSIVDGAAFASERNAVGIVDPFLQQPLEMGQSFWLFLLPNTITGMRHQWAHPAFPDEQFDVPAQNTADKVWLTLKAESFGWTYDRLIQLAQDYWQRGDWFSGNYTDCDFREHYPDIRYHLRGVGIDVPPLDDEYTRFRCSC